MGADRALFALFTIHLISWFSIFTFIAISYYSFHELLDCPEILVVLVTSSVILLFLFVVILIQNHYLDKKIVKIKNQMLLHNVRQEFQECFRECKIDFKDNTIENYQWSLRNQLEKWKNQVITKKNYVKKCTFKTKYSCSEIDDFVPKTMNQSNR